MVLRNAAARQDAHSWYLLAAAVLLGSAVATDLWMHKGMSNQWLLWLFLGLCGSIVVTVVVMGATVPRAYGLTMLAIFFGSQFYFLGLANDVQSVISAVQLMPVLAFYLGWFVRPPIAVPAIFVITVALGAVMLNNPMFDAEGLLGAPVAVHGLAVLLCCFFAGTYLWRRRARVADMDPLTGVLTRRAFLQELDRRIKVPGKRIVSVVAVDFDGLKWINDNKGHAAGDSALVESAREWLATVRHGDTIGRLGGDEFAIILPGASRTQALEIVRRLQSASSYEWSYGISIARKRDTADTMLARADGELYDAKRQRRGAYGTPAS